MEEDGEWSAESEKSNRTNFQMGRFSPHRPQLQLRGARTTSSVIFTAVSRDPTRFMGRRWRVTHLQTVTFDPKSLFQIVVVIVVDKKNQSALEGNVMNNNNQSLTTFFYS